MKTIDDYAFTFGCAYAEACGKDPGDDVAMLGQADKAGLQAAINEALEQAAKECEDPSNWTNKITFGELAASIRRMKS